MEDDLNEYTRKRSEFKLINLISHWLEKWFGHFDPGHRGDGDGKSADAG